MEPGRTLQRAGIRQRVADAVIAPTAVTIGSAQELLTESLREQRFRATLFGLFGAVALALAAIGLYAVQSFAVTQRHREMGIRLAIGGTPADVRRLVFRESLRPVLIGMAAGLIAAWWAAQFVQSYLHQIDARDPRTLAFVAASLVATSLLAAWLPARRAARTDPAIVLRST